METDVPDPRRGNQDTIPDTPAASVFESLVARRWIFVIVTAFALVTACKGSKQAPAATPGGSGAIVTGAGSGSATGSGSAVAGSGSGAVDAAAPKVDPAVRRAYVAGMREGRKATRAMDYKTAIAAFDRALAAKPNDPRALGERGYAQLLDGGDLDAAARDFDRAAGSTKDPKLLAQVWFNRGLLEDKRGNDANAVAAFVNANTLRPTKAAQAKIAGHATCPVTVRRNVDALTDAKPVSGTDWMTLANAIPHDGERVKTDAEAGAMLTGVSKALTPPATGVTTADGVKLGWVVWKRGDTLQAVAIGEAMDGRCPGSLGVTIARTDARWIHARVEEIVEDGYALMCEDQSGDLYECKDVDNEVEAGTACLGGAETVRDVAIEIATGKLALVISQPETSLAEAKVTLTSKGLALAGRSCDRVEPLP